MGYSVALYPGVCLVGALAGCIEELKRLKETGKQRDFKDMITTFIELNNFLGVSYYSNLEKLYGVDVP